MALSRSPWSLALFRAFMDLMREKLRTQPIDSSTEALADLLSRSPDEIDIRMRRDASAHDFRLQKDEVGVLVVLTPVVRNREGLTPQPSPSNASGIVDAWIRATYGEDRGLIMVIESKLYGDADQQQRQKYLAGLGSNSVELDLSWEDVYLLLEFLPEAARSDAIVSDFKDFMDRDPRLVGFTGFHCGDSGNPKRLLEILRRLHQRIARETLDMGGQPLFEEIPKRDSEPDFNMRLRHPSNLPGNVGLVYRGGERLSAKLVIGSRAWEFDSVRIERLLSRPVLDALSNLESSRVQFSVSVRLRAPHAVQMRGVTYVAQQIWNGFGDSIAIRWGEMIRLGESMQRQLCDTPTLNQLRNFSDVYNRSAIDGAEQAAKRPMAYAELVVLLNQSFASLETLPPKTQVESISGDLQSLSRVLLALRDASVSATASS